jgi:hypothetical protein
MNIGMLWFDNDNNVDIFTKIERAAIYYQRKYGRHPDLCFIHPSMLSRLPRVTNSEKDAVQAGDIEVRSSRSVLPNHFWIGINRANGNSAR